MAEYGYIISRNDIAKNLKKFNKNYAGNRTWSDLYSSVNLAGDNQISQLTKDYSEQISNAYIAANSQKALLNSSALGSGFKEYGSLNIEDSLRQAYESYRNTYETNVNTVTENVQAGMDSITSALTEQATNTESYINSMYDYLEHLYNKVMDTESPDEQLSGLLQDRILNGNWKDWFEITKDGSIGDLRLLSKSELFNLFRNEDGSINEKGKIFFKEMLDGLSESEGSRYSFGSYLAEKNPKLLDWAMSNNTFDTNFINNDALVREFLGITNYELPEPEKVEPPVVPPEEPPEELPKELKPDSPYTEQPGALYPTEELNMEFLKYIEGLGIEDTTVFYIPNAKLDYANGKDVPTHDIGYLLSVGNKLGLDTSSWKNSQDAYIALNKYREEFLGKRADEILNGKKTPSSYIKWGRTGK